MSLKAAVNSMPSFTFGKTSSSMTVAFDVRVKRDDSRWIPFRYELMWCKQRDHVLLSWLEDCIGVLTEFGGLPGTEKMLIDDVWCFRVKAVFRGRQDYWGEWDETMDLIKCRAFKKNRRKS